MKLVWQHTDKKGNIKEITKEVQNKVTAVRTNIFKILIVKLLLKIITPRMGQNSNIRAYKT